MAFDPELFSERYDKLNDRQKEAVNYIYGPVMVIAGPGTGKTEVLSMRIANLLRSEAQVQPHEILCLTYTDEATNSMRRRLVQIIGPAAHKVNIYTFHAFCNNVIQNNNEYFSRQWLQPITDLERTELLYKLLEAQRQYIYRHRPAQSPLRYNEARVPHTTAHIRCHRRIHKRPAQPQRVYIPEEVQRV